MKKLNKIPPQDHYVVINQTNQVYVGMMGGSFQYSNDWSKGKPLELSSTRYLMRVKGNELLKL
jgi:hypothetical protein